MKEHLQSVLLGSVHHLLSSWFLTVLVLVLTAPPDVVAVEHLDLLGGQPRPGQQLVEAVHGGVVDVHHLEGELSEAENIILKLGKLHFIYRHLRHFRSDFLTMTFY